MMVAVGLAVGRDVHQLGMRAAVVEALEEAIEEPFAAVEQAFEGDLARDDRIVEEQDDRPPRGEAAQVGARPGSPCRGGWPGA
jgi:hypothetical protein